MYANGAVDTSYDYAVPELGTVPLLNQDGTGRGPAVSSGTSDQDSIFSKTSSRGSKTENKKVSVSSFPSYIARDVAMSNLSNSGIEARFESVR